MNPLAAVLSFSGFLGYVLVYTVWLKRTTPQNIVIGGAAGAVPPLVGLGRHHRQPELDRAVPVRDRLLLDPAPLLGAVAADEGRVRAGRGADDAGGPRRARDPAPDPALLAAALRRDPAALLRRAASAASTSRVGGPRRGVHRRGRAPATAAPTAARRCGSTCTRSPTSRCCSRRWWRTPGCSRSASGRDLLNGPGVAVRVAEEEEAHVVERVGLEESDSRPSPGSRRPLTPRCSSSARAASRSGTTSCRPLSEPGCMSGTIPSPMTIEQPDPGGVSSDDPVPLADPGVSGRPRIRAARVAGLGTVHVRDGDHDTSRSISRALSLHRSVGHASRTHG